MLQYFWWSFSHFLQTIRISIRHRLSLPFDTVDRCVSCTRMRIFSFLLALRVIFPWYSSSFLPRTCPNPAYCPTSHNAPALQASLVHTLHGTSECSFGNCCTHRAAKDQCRKNHSYCHLHTFVLGCCSCSFKASHFLYLSYMVANCHASLCVRRWR